MGSSSLSATNIGLWVSTMEIDAEEAVYEVLSESPPSKTNLLVISCRSGPDDWLAGWKTHIGIGPANLGFIHVGDIARSTAVSSSDSTGTSSPPVVTAISDPADLTGLGIQISKYLEQWAKTDNQTVIYIDSLTILIQFTELNRLYRFLHVLAGRIKSVGGHAFYRVDPNAHDSRTLSTIQSLLDDTIELP